MKNYIKDPYKTSAFFNCKCSNCGKDIKRGESIVYDKYRKLVYCLHKTATDCGSELLQSIRAEKSMDEFGTDIY